MRRPFLSKKQFKKKWHKFVLLQVQTEYGITEHDVKASTLHSIFPVDIILPSIVCVIISLLYFITHRCILASGWFFIPKTNTTKVVKAQKILNDLTSLQYRYH
jgi:hypothetical protein